MRGFLILLVSFACFICIPCLLHAQKKTTYFAWTMGGGALFYPGINEQMRISFPYTSTDASGKTTQYTFNSKAINPYRKPELMGSAFNWELGNLKNFVIFRLSGNDNVTHVSLGYGRNLYFDFPGVKKRPAAERTFTFKPSLNISYNHYGDNTKGSGNFLGAINNYNSILSLLGRTSDPTYSWSTGGDAPQTYTDSTQSLNVYYVQNEWAVIPKVSISNNPHKYVFYYEASIGYYLPVYDRGGLTFYQDDFNKLTPDKPTSISANGVTTTFNNKNITAAPYRFSGVFIDFTVGFCFSQIRHLKRQGKHPHWFVN